MGWLYQTGQEDYSVARAASDRHLADLLDDGPGPEETPSWGVFQLLRSRKLAAIPAGTAPTESQAKTLAARLKERHPGQQFRVQPLP